MGRAIFVRNTRRVNVAKTRAHRDPLFFCFYCVVFYFCALPTGSGSAAALLAGVVSQTPNRVGRSGLASRRWLGLHTSREGEPSVFMYARHNPS